MNDVTYDVRVYKTEVYQGTKVITHTVRWKAGGKPWKRPFRTAAHADAFRSELVAAARKGEAFSLMTGEPVSWERATNGMSWYDFASAYADMKWKPASAKYRYDIARALTSAVPAMYTTERGRPEEADIRTALMRWGFNARKRADSPRDVTVVLRWLAGNTRPVTALSDPVTLRRMLDVATTKLNGKRAAPSTVLRHRAILYNALEYAVEIRLLTTNPMKELKWKAPKVSREVDRRSVINHNQARKLLDAIHAQEPSGPRLVGFFAVMYYSGLRPEEAVNLRLHNITLPEQVWNPDTEVLEEPADSWGELHISTAAPEVPRDWTDDGKAREERGLKHRAEGESRSVPCPPELTRLLRAHLQKFGIGPDGRIFTGLRADELPPATIRRAWDKARKAALTMQDYDSPLVRRPYDLRHACLSTWLNGGVPPTQVAAWAGHSLDVLLRIYAKCIVGQDEVARRRISEALRT